MDVVLITGASTGFGRVTAERLARRGFQVFATMRDVAGRNATARAHADLRSDAVSRRALRGARQSAARDGRRDDHALPAG